MIYKLNGVIFDINKEHLIGEVNYPRNWFLDAGNRDVMGITEEADPVYVLPVPTSEEIQAQLTQAVQTHLDAMAQSRGYDSIFTACTYEGDPNPGWSAEGAAYKAWRSAVWQYCLQVLTDVQNGLRTIPTEAELLAELPVLGGV